jgi:hypothetical protein
MIDIRLPVESKADTPVHERVLAHCRPKNGPKSPKRPLLRGGSKRPQNKDSIMAMTGKKDRMMSFLFGREGVVLRNIKFFRGDRELVSEEEFCHQVHSAVMQERMGKARVTPMFKDESPPISVREFIATL